MRFFILASEGWGRYCFHWCVSVHTRGGVLQSQAGNTPVPGVTLVSGGVPQSLVGGTPTHPPPRDRTAERVLATRLAISLLRSHRRTVFYFNVRIHNFIVHLNVVWDSKRDMLTSTVVGIIITEEYAHRKLSVSGFETLQLVGRCRQRVCFCFCSKCCRESSRYYFCPSETFLGGKSLTTETFLSGTHFSLRTF